MPAGNEYHIKRIVGDHDSAFPQAQTSVGQKDQAEGGRNDKEANVADEAFSGDLKGVDNSH